MDLFKCGRADLPAERAALERTLGARARGLRPGDASPRTRAFKTLAAGSPSPFSAAARPAALPDLLQTYSLRTGSRLHAVTRASLSLTDESVQSRNVEPKLTFLFFPERRYLSCSSPETDVEPDEKPRAI